MCMYIYNVLFFECSEIMKELTTTVSQSPKAYIHGQNDLVLGCCDDDEELDVTRGGEYWPADWGGNQEKICV